MADSAAPSKSQQTKHRKPMSRMKALEKKISETWHYFTFPNNTAEREAIDSARPTKAEAELWNAKVIRMGSNILDLARDFMCSQAADLQAALKERLGTVNQVSFDLAMITSSITVSDSGTRRKNFNTSIQGEPTCHLPVDAPRPTN
jgi:hypothetical protein